MERASVEGSPEWHGPAGPALGVLVVSGISLLREGAYALLRRSGRYWPIRSADTVEQALMEIAREPVDLLLMDLSSRASVGATGGSACRNLLTAWPTLRIVILSSPWLQDEALDGIRAGALGCVSRNSPAEVLLTAMDTVARGEHFFDPSITQAIVSRLAQSAPAPAAEARLSSLDLQILHLIAAGQTNRQIAAALSLSESTVRTYNTRIFRTIGASTRAEAAAFLTRMARRQSGPPQERPYPLG